MSETATKTETQFAIRELSVDELGIPELIDKAADIDARIKARTEFYLEQIQELYAQKKYIEQRLTAAITVIEDEYGKLDDTKRAVNNAYVRRLVTRKTATFDETATGPLRIAVESGYITKSERYHLTLENAERLVRENSGLAEDLNIGIEGGIPGGIEVTATKQTLSGNYLHEHFDAVR